MRCAVLSAYTGLTAHVVVVAAAAYDESLCQTIRAQLISKRLPEKRTAPTFQRHCFHYFCALIADCSFYFVWVGFGLLRYVLCDLSPRIMRSCIPLLQSSAISSQSSQIKRKKCCIPRTGYLCPCTTPSSHHGWLVQHTPMQCLWYLNISCTSFHSYISER